jgi:hypothetical protein
MYWESRMLSFELSAIDLILAVAVIILLVLYITKSSAKPPVEKKLLVEKESSSREPVMEATMPETTISEATMPEATVPEEEIESPVSTQPKPKTGSAGCPYGFGYLRKLDKEASIPDGCLGCSRIMECYSAS